MLSPPFWSSDTMHDESLLFIADSPSNPPSAPLLFKPTKLLRLRSADFLTEYLPGKDYRLAPDGCSLVLLPGSRIPARTLAELHPAPDSPNSIAQSRDGRSWLLWAEGHFFHDIQTSVSYTHSTPWPGPVPVFQSVNLARTIALLDTRRSLTLSVAGDSISAGYNASGFTDAPPRQPAYPQLVAAGLERACRAKVTLRNRAVAGWNSSHGLADAHNLAADHPDLVIIAFGMNDPEPIAYADNVTAIIRTLRSVNPNADFILVASMLGNPEWSVVDPHKFPQLRDALASLCAPGVALADMTTLWQTLLKSKRWLDLAGNGVNHPNDFGHRLYAQTILSLLVENYAKK